MTKIDSTIAENFELLFKGNPFGRIELTVVREGSKEVRERKGRQRRKHVAYHLTSKNPDGRGTQGVKLGWPSDPNTKSPWVTDWVALDFDKSRPANLGGFFNALLERSVFPYFTTGTTGRGAHVFLFFDTPIACVDAHKMLCKLSDLAIALGHERPEIRPSAPIGGAGILLPYRGAAHDGFGINPLFDAQWNDGSEAQIETRDHAVSLFNVASICRTTTGDLTALTTPVRVTLQPRPRPAPSNLPPYQLWKQELERVKPFWRVGVRNHLCLAVTGFGCFLNVPDEHIERDVLEIVQGSGDDIAERRRSIRATLKRRHDQRAGKPVRVAFKPFYALAGLDLPLRASLEDDLETKLTKLEGLECCQFTLDRAGARNRTVLLAIVEYARRFGQRHERGIKVSVSRRELAEHLGLGKSTVSNAIADLKNQGKIQTQGAADKLAAEILVVILDNLTTPCSLVRGCAVPFFTPNSYHNLLLALQHHQTLSLEELSRLCQHKPNTTKTQLRTLTKNGAVTRTNAGFALSTDWQAQLRADFGAAFESEQQRLRQLHEKERTRYHQHLYGERDQQNTLSSANQIEHVVAKLEEFATDPQRFHIILSNFSDHHVYQAFQTHIPEVKLLDVIQRAVQTKAHLTSPPDEPRQEHPFVDPGTGRRRRPSAKIKPQASLRLPRSKGIEELEELLITLT